MCVCVCVCVCVCWNLLYCFTTSAKSSAQYICVWKSMPEFTYLSACVNL